MRTSSLVGVGLAIGVAAASGVRDAHADEMALWRIVDTQCAPAKQAGKPVSPCIDVVLDGSQGPGFAVLKDLVGVAQVLLIPTRRLTGIEDTGALEPQAARYWADAWAARFFVFGFLGRAIPRDAIVLAINSKEARSQDQFHIHVDCIREDVRSLLRQRLGDIGHAWQPLGTSVYGANYMVRRLDGDDLGRLNLFADVAAKVPGAAADMGAETIAVVGATFPDGLDGFLVLEDRAGRTPYDRGHSEDLQDHACAVAGR